jgi:PadR family transcriptional regulator, regulatory protein PadR
MPDTESDFYDNWTVQVRKGVLELCILHALAQGEHYGYALVKGVAAVPGLHVAEGTIYPLLSRLRQEELVETRLEESPEGPARKYYALTDRGRQELEAMNRYWQGLVKAVEQVRRDGLPPV